MLDNGNRTSVSERFCVVGAGPSGLIAARALLRRGIDVDVVDRNPSIGGMWEISHADSALYESTNFISDKANSGFIEYPLPDDYPDFPRWDQIRDYIRKFADEYDITARVETGVEVTSAAPLSPSGRDGWRVQFDSGEERVYRGVVWACGQQHAPYMPTPLGAETFTGELIHSSQYKSTQAFAGRRVLVVGGGNSAVDIASDAASVGASASLSLRRGYWIMPKSLFGLSFQGLLYGQIQVPPELGIKVPEDPAERLDWILQAFGDYERLGLPVPDEPFFASHTTVSDQVSHHLMHGRLSIRPGIERIDGDEVVYVDGTREQMDVICMATGYSVEIPWLDPGLVDWVEDQPYFHLGSISQKVHGLYACGLVHFGGNTYDTWDKLFQVAVADIIADLTGEGAEEAAKVRDSYRPDLKGGLPLRKSHRNINQYDIVALMQTIEELEQKFGVEMPGMDNPDFYSQTHATHAKTDSGIDTIAAIHGPSL